MRKQFNLQDWLKDKSQKVETRDGRQVKIISFEMTDTNDCPIAAQFRLCAGTPVVYLFDKEGHYKGEGNSDYDLFIVTPEEELSEFEKELESFYNHHLQVCTYDNQGTVEDSLHDGASKLLALARKELEPEIKAEALKDLPRWKKAGLNTGQTILVIGYTSEEDKLYRNGYVISLTDLEKLPKEDEE